VTNLLPEELPPGESLFEGARRTMTINAYERNPDARARCLRRWGTACIVCEFDFGGVYGPEYEGYIHVHHLVPLSQISRSYIVDPEKDLRPVCPNCHAAIHRDPVAPVSIEDLKAKIMGRSRRRRWR
jgi:5-methylcytosine-specific restriction protein A